MGKEFRIYNVLRPLGWLYGAFTTLRNYLFDHVGRLSSTFPVPVISVGNITVGGTGKTPHTEYLVSLLKQKARVAVLSRGYGRCTSGYIQALATSDSRTIGDEPLQIHNRFPDIDVAVCENRAKGINTLLSTCSPGVIILDDAFQHRKVTPSLNILLVNYNRNILSDAMLPAGLMRESAKGRRRAHIIIVTKCPDNLSQQEMDSMATSLRIDKSQQVFFTAQQYGTPYPFGKPESPSDLPQGPVLAVTGIASPQSMQDELSRMGHQVTLMTYPDHHRYNNQDINSITGKLNSLGPDAFIVTTAKDAARLSDLDMDAGLCGKIHVLPVGVRFLRDRELFDRTVTEHVKSFGK